MKIAIIGSGIAGNVVAHHLHREHEITLYEAGGHVGGHTHTHIVEQAGRSYRVDTGFVVFNRLTYPNFIALLDELGVESQESSMSFSVRCVERPGIQRHDGEFTLRTAPQPAEACLSRHDPRHTALQPRGPRTAPRARRRDAARRIPGARPLRPHLRRLYIVPMAAAIWSTDPQSIFSFPVRFFIRFFYNHGMLTVNDRPVWRTVRGGAASYVEKLIAPFRDRIRLNTPVEWMRRLPGSVILKARGLEPQYYDAAFLACHSDQALRILADPSALERDVLGAIRYQTNEAVLHSDTRILPRKRLARAAWNYHVLAESGRPVALTYDMNVLQRLDAPTPFLVTLNRSDAIDPERIIKRMQYQHPLYTPASVAAQARQRELNGQLGTYYSGAWWGNGFHEDGVTSALAAIGHFREDYAQRAVYRSA